MNQVSAETVEINANDIYEAGSENDADRNFIYRTVVGLGYSMDEDLFSVAYILAGRGYSMASIRRRFW